jgi:predicted acetyltransferase
MGNELRPLTIQDGRDVYEMLQEIPSDENGFVNGMHGKSYAEFEQWLARCDAAARGVGLEDWQVPQSTFWLYADGRPVGYGKVRHRLTEKLLEEGGTIGYGVRPSARGRGDGKLLLNCLLEEAWRLGADRALLTIRVGNAPSLGVALANGGVIAKTENGRRYVWIERDR